MQETSEELRVEASVLEAGLADLAQRQQLVRKAGKWLHADQDFSGGPSASVGQLPAGPVLEASLGEPSPAHIEELRRLDRCLNAQSLAGLSGAPGEGEGLQAELRSGSMGLTRREAGLATDGSSLANLSSTPTIDNVAEFSHYFTAVGCSLKDSDAWKRKTSTQKNDVMLWHHLELKRVYYRLLDARDERIVRSAQGQERVVPLSH